MQILWKCPCPYLSSPAYKPILCVRSRPNRSGFTAWVLWLYHQRLRGPGASWTTGLSHDQRRELGTRAQLRRACRKARARGPGAVALRLARLISRARGGGRLILATQTAVSGVAGPLLGSRACCAAAGPVRRQGRPEVIAWSKSGIVKLRGRKFPAKLRAARAAG